MSILRQCLILGILSSALFACGGGKAPTVSPQEKSQGEGEAKPLDSSPDSSSDSGLSSLAEGVAVFEKNTMVRGGLLYDRWWAALNIKPPEGDHPMWSTQSTNSRHGATTWRCKECHAWDYQGRDGAYGGGSHFTGFPGLMKVSSNSPEEIKVMLTAPNHDFSMMGEEAIDQLIVFLRVGVTDVSPFIDAQTKRVLGADLGRGKKMWSETCVECHGEMGKEMNFGSPDSPKFIGDLAKVNPWEFFHKSRFGHPGTGMPSGVLEGWSIEDVRDVTAFAQSLPGIQD